MNYFNSTLTLALSAVVMAGCGGDGSTSASDSETTATTDATTTGTETTGTETDPTTDTTLMPTTEGPSTDPTMSESESGTMMMTDPTGMPTDGTESDSESDTDSDSESDSESESDSDTGNVCEFADGEYFNVDLINVDEPNPTCQTLEFFGRVEEVEGNTWKLDNCPCGSECLLPDPWELTVEGPANYMPEVPDCVRIIYETTQGFDMSCHFSGVAMWPTEVEDRPLVYLAGGSVVNEVGEVTLDTPLEATCPCEGCCGDDQLYSLSFAANGGELALQETESGELPGHQNGFVFDAINFRSHASGLCDTDEPVFLWVLKLVIQA